jgi:signal transduction histidine kinase/CHASE3 domain sensor protein
LAAGHDRILPALRRAFWLGSAALVAVALTFAFLSWLNHRGLQLVLDSQRVSRLARESRGLIVDRESAVRGYLLSRQELSLAPEFSARKALASKLDSLVVLSKDNASQQDRAKMLRAAVERWERGWVFPVLDPANAHVALTSQATLAGKELFDSIRSSLESFMSGEQRIFNMRVRMLSGLQRIMFGLIIAEIAILLGILLWLSRRALSQADQLIRQQEQLENQSLDLQTQTAELEEQAVELEEQADEANRANMALQETNDYLEATIKRLEAAESNVGTARMQIQDTKSLLDFVLNHSPVGIVLYDTDRRVVRVNAAIEGITALPSLDHIGKTVYEFMSDDIAEVADSAIERVLETKVPITNVPLSGATRSDMMKERHFLASYFPVTLPGNHEGAASLVLETTQYRRLEEQLLQSQKMEAVGRLAGGVAHDFNNMLTAIMSYGELLLSDMAPDSQQRADMTEIVKAAEKATALTKKLLAFSRQQVLRPETVDINATVEGLRKMMRRLTGNDIELSLRLAANLWTVAADPTELERVIMNLVLNSRDAMPGHGNLIIETSNVTIDEDYASAHADTTPGPYVMISVSDTGAGMTREVREKLFEPFFTTKEKGKGTGLGLPSVYGIVKQSGGFVWVYSEPGKGTTFKVYLPKSEAQSNRKNTPTRTRKVGSETILLVEDDDEVRSVATRILRRNGYRVLEAGNGADALRVCEEADEPVDLIVTDIVMPEMNGPELAERIRDKQPDARILFTSGYTEDAVVRQSFLHPGEAFIEKPFTPASLAKKARELLDPDRSDVS